MDAVENAARPGGLRDNVQVVFADDSVRVTYGLWQVSLPTAWVSANADITAFLARRATRRDLTAHSEVSAVISLLERQGCLVPEPLAGPVSLRLLRDRFEQLRGAWYATYYAHPLWERLRTGEASRNELLAYLVHNYHVSRAAGSVAARMACRGPAAWRPFFAGDAGEEYWHCDAYYFVQSSALGCPDDQMKRYIPLPASTAFEQHALQLAEHDSVAHLLIAYFQESSVMFRGDADDFYAQVSHSYQLSDFFRPWQAHIDIDIAEEHAAGLAALFTDDVVIDAQAAARSLSLAWAGFHFLCASLDDIAGEARLDTEIVPRDPAPRAAWMRVSAGDQLESAADLASLTARYTEGRPHVELGTIARGDLPYVAGAVHKTSLLALAAGRGHNEIMIAGRIHQQLAELREPDTLPRSPWTLALSNTLAEAATRPLEWAALVASIVRRLAPWPALTIDQIELDRRLGDVSVAAAPSLVIALAQLHELLDRWAASTVTFPSDLCPVL